MSDQLREDKGAEVPEYTITRCAVHRTELEMRPHDHAICPECGPDVWPATEHVIVVAKADLGAVEDGQEGLRDERCDECGGASGHYCDCTQVEGRIEKPICRHGFGRQTCAVCSSLPDAQIEHELHRGLSSTPQSVTPEAATDAPCKADAPSVSDQLSALTAALKGEIGRLRVEAGDRQLNDFAQQQAEADAFHLERLLDQQTKGSEQ